MVNVDPTADAVPLLQMRGIVKQFPGARALDGVDLEIRAGEVHCLLGQNGAGKSTLIKVLAGAHQPDEGEILARRPARHHRAPGRRPAARHRDDVPGARRRRRAVRRGEHLPRATSSPPAASRSGAPRRPNTRALLKRLGHGDISPHREVGRLSAAGKQIVSMARALSHDARVIVMDEPSAVLDAEEVDQPLPRGPRAHGVGRRRRLHLAPPRGDPPDRRPDHGAQGRPDGRDGPARRGRRPTAELIKLMTGRNVEYAIPPRPPVRRGRRHGAAASTGSRCAGRSATCRSRCAPARSSASPGSSARVAPRSSRPIFGARRATAGTVRVGDRRLRAGLGERRGQGGHRAVPRGAQEPG